MARRHRPLFPLPCPRRNRYAPSSSLQSPLSSVSAWRRKLRPLPCSSSPNRTRLRWAPVWLAASPPNTGEFLQSPLSSVSAWRRKLRPLPCSSSPNRTRLRWASIWVAASPPNTGECLQSPLSSVSAWRRKLRPLPCSSSPNRTRLRWAPVWLAASPPFGRKPFWFGKIKKLGPYRRAFARRYGRRLLGKTQTFSGSG